MLSAQDLAKRLDVSVAVIEAALANLERQGLVTKVPPCKTNGDDEHNHTCPFCGALPMARCRYEPDQG